MPLPIIQDEPKKAPKSPIEDEQERVKQSLKNIKYKIGVHSGKGGVGKTFVSCNLAMLLAAEGYSVGLLDADVDCPNIQDFLNISAELMLDDKEQLIPLVYKGVKIVSTGFIQDKEEALIIRGPIKHRVLTDFLEKTLWGPLDYLVIDFPPGTSDIPLSAMQYADLTGIILVTTPQKEAVADATRAANMAKRLGIRIIGLIENMSGEVFGSKGEQLAKKLGVEFIGSIPLEREIRELSDRGEAAFLEQTLEQFSASLLKQLPK